MSFPLFTSIRPPQNDAELAALHDCIVSWHRNGFHPVALNGGAEIEALKPLHLGVDFTMLPSDGKPRIGAMLDAVRVHGAAVAGIINSDCRMIEVPGLAGRLAAALPGRLAAASGIDVDVDGKPTAQRRGFEAFFFDVGILPADDGGYHIAEPYWDHWFPLAAEMAGAAVETVTAPLLVHRAHPERWSPEGFREAGLRFNAFLMAWQARGDMPETLASMVPLPDMDSGAWPGCLSPVAPQWLLRHRPQRIAVLPSDAGEVEAMLRLAGEAVFDAQYHHLTPAPTPEPPPPPPPPIIVYVERPRRFRFPKPLRWLGNVPGKLLKPLRRRLLAVPASVSADR